MKIISNQDVNVCIPNQEAIGQETIKKIEELLESAEKTKESNLEKAIEVLYEAAKLIPSLKDAKQSVKNTTHNTDGQKILYLSKYGNILYEIEKYEKALKCYEQIAKFLPTEYQIYKAKGDCYRNLGKYQESIVEYKRGINIVKSNNFADDKDEAFILNNKALSYIEMNENDSALKDLEEAIKLDKDNPLYYCNMGNVLYSLGDAAKGVGCFETAQKLVAEGKLGILDKGNIRFIEKTLKDLVGLEGTVNKVVENIKKFNQNNLEVIQIKEKVYSILTDKDKLVVEILKPIVNGSFKSITDKGFYTRMNKLEAQLHQLEEKLREQEQQIQLIRDKIKNFEDKFPKSTLEFLQKKKEAEEKALNDPRLKDYYNGFINEFNIAFTTAQAIASGNIKFEGDKSTLVSACSTLLSFLPFFGDKISEGIDFVHNQLVNTKFKQQCGNISEFGVNSIGFDRIAEYTAASIVLDAKSANIIKNQAKKSAQDWLEKIEKTFEKFKIKAEDKIWKNYKNDMSAQKALGHRDAQEVLAKYIITGKILEFESDTQLSELVKFSLKSDAESFPIIDPTKKECIEFTKQVKSSKTKEDLCSKCAKCEVFYVVNQEFNNPAIDFFNKNPNSKLFTFIKENYGDIGVHNFINSFESDLILGND